MTSTDQTTAGAAAAPETPAPPRQNQILKEIFGGSAMISFLAIILALIFGGLLIVLTDPVVQQTSAYFFSRPGDTFVAIAEAVGGAYAALFRGSVFNYLRADEFGAAIRPLTESLTNATPLIAAGLGVALAFRVGLFNIGGRGQILIAAAAAGYVGAYVPMPPVIHLIVALVVGLIGGALWGGLVGLLKARTGAHEVIVTIMLNYIAFYLISFLLRTPGALQAPGQSNPRSGPMLETAVFPKIAGEEYNLNIGFILVIVATIYVWYLLNRSAMGFQFRAVGENPHAARVAGINVERTYITVMVIAGALVGLAGVQQALGNFTGGIAAGLDAGIGFDAITVALLGRSKPIGVFFAGILFGALKAGAVTMQAAEGIPVDIVLVVQSFIVLFIAAPPLVRALFRLPTPDPLFHWRKPQLARKAEVTK
ncbi:nucleoside ABC transporter membrane protein [Microcella putealis]|uniref:Nucleoside ABC transporter membrane protein n=1 Tax=Microcella putealis TaxID=337005 RepID=A0A4Q7LRJ0_9MICO|nr:ABC transporter permease [Microcella putealis]RZS57364.1 nucleoside ABC transporter membrane protein [Microcella putealis]TQM19493.1 nucleoside ABC transporter membrane protein [Microcella putealis]